jgi:hypothetical protein
MPFSPIILSLALAWPFSHPADSHRQHQRIGDWTLTAVRYTFSDEITCELTARRARYERQAVVLRLPSKIDTSTAFYRVDGGAPRSVREDAFELAKQGFRLTADDLQNPSEGLVRIPAATPPIRTIAVQTRLGGPVTTFKVYGLGAALYVAHAAGCGAFQ